MPEVTEEWIHHSGTEDTKGNRRSDAHKKPDAARLTFLRNACSQFARFPARKLQFPRLLLASRTLCLCGEIPPPCPLPGTLLETIGPGYPTGQRLKIVLALGIKNQVPKGWDGHRDDAQAAKNICGPLRESADR